jgi:hypothetical protein
MDIKDFLNHTAAGNAVKAQEILNDILSNKAFESLDQKKSQIAKTLYATEDEVEVQDTADTAVEDEELLTQEEFDSLSEEDQELYLESLEQLDELSPETHRSYQKKAEKSIRASFKNQKNVPRGSPEAKADAVKTLNRMSAVERSKDKEFEGAFKRRYGKAAKKNMKEEMEQIDELSKETLGRYVQKRVKQIPNIEVNYQMTPDDDGPMGAKRIRKFQKKINKGVTGALNRLSGTNVTKKPTK